MSVRSLTEAKMEQALRGLLVAGAVVVRLGELSGCRARVDFAQKPYRITVDPFRIALLDGLVHELFHVAEYDRLDGWGDFEEGLADTLEEQMVCYIERSKRRLAWWRARAREVTDEAQA
jgi:hypothetical protein